MPRRIFAAGSVTNATGAPLRLEFYPTSTSIRREVDLWTIDGSNNLLERIPNGVVLTNSAGAYSAFAGPDDLDTLYALPSNTTSRTTLTGSSTNVPGAAASTWATPAASATLTGTLAAWVVTAVDCTAGAGARTLPAASAVPAGTAVSAKKADTSSNNLVVSRAGSDLIFGTGSGSTSKTLSLAGEAVEFVSNGVDKWTIRSSDTPSGALANTYAKLPGQVKNNLTGWYHSDGWVTGDRVDLTDAAITTGTAILTSASASFTSSDVGKVIAVFGAGASGGPLNTTILSRQSATQVTLSANAATSVTGANASYGTDNATNLQAWLTATPANATAYLAAGAYCTTAALTLGNTGMQVRGASRESSTIRAFYATNTVSSGILQVNAGGVVIDSIGLSGMGDGPEIVGAVNIGSNTGSIAGYSGVTVRNCHIQDVAGHGIIGQREAANVTVTNNLIERVGSGSTFGNDGHGVSVVGPGWVVTGNRIIGSRVRGIEVFGATALSAPTTNFTVANNVVTGSSNRGIVLCDCNDGTVSGNTVVSNGAEGIYSGLSGSVGVYDVTIAGNACKSNTGDGIRIDRLSGRITITGNTCESNNNGISIGTGGTGSQKCSVVTISGNLCYRNTSSGGAGINVSNAQDAAITGNTMVENGFGGSANASYGILLFTTNDGVTLVGNRGTDRQGTKTQKFAVCVFANGSTTNVVATGNNGIGSADGTYDIYIDPGITSHFKTSNLGRVNGTGTAVLTGGTVTVSDAAMTTAAEIRLAVRTLGGTPGALYVSAKTASTSFAITSSSGTDTSTVAYEVTKYA